MMAETFASVVADSSIFLASVLEEPYSAQADLLIKRWTEQNIAVFAPILFRYELFSVGRRNVYREKLKPEIALLVQDNLLNLIKNITFVIDDPLLQRGYILAQEFNRPTANDSQYLALAERLNCEFWTVDERLFNTVYQRLGWVRWISSP